MCATVHGGPSFEPPPPHTLLQDGMLNSTPQQGCIWTKVFLARKVFLASGQGQYMLKNGFFQP